jgi:hypothetical protein
MIKLLKIIIFFFIVVNVFISCSGGRISISAPNVNKVVSITESVYDKNFNIINAADYEVIKEFNFTVSKWYLFWTIIPLSSDVDISEKLNKIIEENDGDGIVNLQVSTAAEGFGDLFNFPSMLIPILPSFVMAEISGEVIKVRK